MNSETFFEKFEIFADAPNGVQKLREMILQLAVQGKLVPQDPNDEPAAVLLEKIRVEKERLIKEKRLKKANLLPLIKSDEMPYQLPDSWSWVRLGEICNLIGGGTPSTKNSEYFDTDGIPWLTPADLSGLKKKYVSHGKRDITELGLKKSSAQLLPKGTVLFSCRAPIGYVAIAENQISTNQGFKSCVPYIMAMSDYIYWFLKFAGREIDEKAPGTTFREVSGKILSHVPFSLPPPTEQKRIVVKIERLMSLCDELEVRKQKRDKKRAALNEALLDELLSAESHKDFQKHWQRICDNFDLLYDNSENVGKLRQAILELAVRGKLVPQNPDDEPVSELLEKIRAEKELLIREKKIKRAKPLQSVAGDEKIPYILPNGLEWIRLDEISLIVQYGYTASADSSFKNLKFLRITDIQNGHVNWSTVPGCRIDEKAIDSYKLNNGDLLIARTGGTIGKSFLIYDLPVQSIFASYLIRIVPSSFMLPKYMKYFLESPLYWTQLYAESKGTGQPNVNGTALRSLLFPLPSEQEQKRIVAKVEQLMALCDKLDSKIKQAQSDIERILAEAVASLTGNM